MKRMTGSGLLYFGLCVLLVALSASRATGESLAGTYRTASNASALYQYQPDGIQNVTLPLDVTMEFSSDDPTTMLSATIHKPIIGATEDGTPIYPIANDFPMSVTGTSSDGRNFQGDLLGTQYLFDWQIERADNGELRWSGTVGWAGGRIELTTITEARLVPVPEPATAAMFFMGMLALVTLRRAVVP